MIDRTIALAEHAAEAIRRSRRLELICDPQLSTVVFRYCPAARDIDADTLNARLRQDLFETGQAVIGHTRVKQRQCLKFTCMNPSITEKQMEELISVVETHGEKLEEVHAK